MEFFNRMNLNLLLQKAKELITQLLCFWSFDLLLSALVQRDRI